MTYGRPPRLTPPTPVPHTLDALREQLDITPAGIGAVAQSLPTAAGNRTKRFNSELSLYNATADNMRGFRQALGKAKGGSLSTLTFIGDSKVSGQGTNNNVSINAATNMPGQVRQLLNSSGYPTAGTGPVFAYQNSPTAGDSRFTFTGTWAGSSNFRTTTTTGSKATFTSDLAGTVVEIRGMSNSGPFTYSIDGGAPVTVTPPGGTTLMATTITGLPNTTHTVVITSTSTTETFLLSINVRQTAGLQIANNGVSGSSSASWIAPQWYSPKLVAQNLPSDGVIISLGTNDAGSGVTTATFKTNMTTIINAHKALNRPVMLVVPTAPATGAAANFAAWPAYIAAHYDLADSLDIPLVDLSHVQGTHAQANAAGMFYDNLHEKEAGYAVNAAAIAAALVR